jgi:hypothetical protein
MEVKERAFNESPRGKRHQLFYRSPGVQKHRLEQRNERHIGDTLTRQHTYR